MIGAASNDVPMTFRFVGFLFGVLAAGLLLACATVAVPGEPAADPSGLPPSEMNDDPSDAGPVDSRRFEPIPPAVSY